MDDEKSTTEWLVHLIRSSKSKREIDTMSMEYSGDSEDVIGPIELAGGLHIVAYSFKATDDYPRFTVSIQNVKDDDDEHEVYISNSDMKKGRKHQGKQSVRLNGGRYLVSIEVDDCTDWTLSLESIR